MNGNGIIQSKAAQAQLIKETHTLGLQVKDLLEKDERSTAEINRLKSLTSDYGTICKDCNRGRWLGEMPVGRGGG